MDRPLAVWVIGRSAWVLEETSAMALHRGRRMTSAAVTEIVNRPGAATESQSGVDSIERCQRAAEQLREMGPIDPRD